MNRLLPAVRQRLLLSLAVFGFIANSAWSQDAAPALEVVAVVGAELRMCGAGETISSGIVLIQGDSIIAVGDSTLTIPTGAKIIDAKGCVVTPGLIDARSKLWLATDSANATATDAGLDILDGVDPYSEDWHEVLRSGVTTVYLQPSSKGSLGGFGAVVSVMPKPMGGIAVLSPKAGLQASLGVSASNNRARQQELDRTKKILDAALDYRKKWVEYEAYIAKQAKEPAKDASVAKSDAGLADAKAPASPALSPTGSTPPSAPTPGPRGRSLGGRPSNAPEGGAPSRLMPPQADASPKTEEDKSKEKPVKKPDREPSKEELLRVIRGEIPLRLEVHGPDDVYYALKLFEGDALKGVQIVFEGLSDLRSATKVIRDLKNPIVLGPWLDLEREDAESDMSASRWGADFSTYGGVLIIASNGKTSLSSKFLRANAAKAISHGMSQERALRAITIDAAKALGVDDRIGSLSKGKRADLVCFRGEPTNPAIATSWSMTGGVVLNSVPAVPASAIDPNDAMRITAKPLDLHVPLPKCFALRTSRCWLEGRLQPAIIQVCNGKIVGLGKESSETELGYPVFDLADAVVSPGLVSSHANFGLGRLIDPQQESDASLVVAADGFVGDFDGQQKLLDGGLLRAMLAPGSSNPLSGTVSLVRIGALEPSVNRDAATKLVLAGSARNPNRFPSSLAGQIQLVSQSLKGTLLPSRVYLPATIEQQLQKQRLSTWNEVASGKRVALIEAQTDAEILAALQLMETQKLNALLLGPRQLQKHLDRLLESKCTIVVQPLTASSFDWYVQDIVQAAKVGIPICFAGETAEQLRLTAAMAVAAGADHNAMLAALCELPKSLAGSSKTAGWVVDEPADLVIWSGSPLNLGAQALHVLVDGQVATKKDN